MVEPQYGHILDSSVDKFRPHRNAMLIEMQLAHSTTIIEILCVDTTRTKSKVRGSYSG